MSKEIYINTGTSFQQQYTARQPAIGTAPVTAQYDAQGNASAQNPYIYQSRSPYTFQAQVNAQTPYIASAQQPYPYIAHTQQPYIANAQQPYPYIAQARQPYPYIANAQQPYPYIASAQTPYPANAQSPYPYPASAQQPYPYQASAQTAYPANAQQPYPYIASSQTPYPASSQTPYPANAQTTKQANVNVQTTRQAAANSQTPLGTGIQHTKTDHTPTGQTLTAQVYGTESAFGYIVWRGIRVQWRLHWWRHSNGYGYAYWYVRRGTPTYTELGGIQTTNSLVYLTQGNVPFNTSNWRLVEQWSFWNSIWPDSISLGSLSVSATLGSFPVTTTTGSNTTNSAEGYKEYLWECEEGFSVPVGGSRNVNLTMVPTAIKANYPNLTGGTHITNVTGHITCYWGCFLAGSKVLLENNTTKNIEDMEVGDKVIGKDGIVNALKELRTYDKRDIRVYTINGSFKTTAAHPLLTTDGWKSCDGSAGQQGHPELNITELAVGDKLLKDAGNANGDTVEEEITTITVATPSGTTTFYNLDVTDSPSGNDTYVVDDYIVHNK